MPYLTGECLCGEVKYAVNGDLGSIIHCHCSECRKWHGAAFRTRTVVRKQDFYWVQGEDSVSYYDGLPNVIKTFCRQCGSNLVSLYKHNQAMIGLPLGGVEGDLAVGPEYHIFTDNKASWHSITDNLPQYAALPPEKTAIHKIKNK